MNSTLGLLGFVFSMAGAALAPAQEPALPPAPAQDAPAAQVIDACVGVWIADGHYVCVHASGRRTRHFRDDAGTWKTEELGTFGRTTVAAIQSKDALHAVAAGGELLTSVSASGPFEAHHSPLTGKAGWPGYLHEVRFDRNSPWLLLQLPTNEHQLVECRGTKLRVAGTSPASMYPSSGVDPLGRVLFSPRLGTKKNIELWRPSADTVAIEPLLETALGNWCSGSMVQGPSDRPEVLMGVNEGPPGGGAYDHSLVQFRSDGQGALVETQRVHTMGFLFGPDQLRPSGERVFTTAGGASVSAVDAKTLRTIWSRPGKGSGMASTKTWASADGKSLLVYGSADTFVLSTEDGTDISAPAAPSYIYTVRGRGQEGELIVVLDDYEFAVLRDGGDWSVLHRFR